MRLLASADLRILVLAGCALYEIELLPTRACPFEHLPV